MLKISEIYVCSNQLWWMRTLWCFLYFLLLPTDTMDRRINKKERHEHLKGSWYDCPCVSSFCSLDLADLWLTDSIWVLKWQKRHLEHSWRKTKINSHISDSIFYCVKQKFGFRDGEFLWRKNKQVDFVGWYDRFAQHFPTRQIYLNLDNLSWMLASIPFVYRL